MDNYFKLSFPEVTEKGQSENKTLPENYPHCITYATAYTITNEEATCVLQSYCGHGFYTFFITLEVKTDTLLRIEILQKSIVFLAVLKGYKDVSFPDQVGEKIAGAGQCLVRYLPMANTTQNLKKGSYIFQGFIVNADFLKGHEARYPDMAHALLALRTHTLQAYSYPILPLSKTKKNILSRMRRITLTKGEFLEPVLKEELLSTLDACHKRFGEKNLQQSPEQIATDIKNHIIRQVKEGKKVNVMELHPNYTIAYDSLLSTFKKLFGISMKDFLSGQSMEKARHLLIEGMKVKEVARILHYKDPATFSRAYKLYYKYPPSEAGSASIL